MQYLLMCCFDEKSWNAIPEQEREVVMRYYGAWIDKATASGQYLAGGKLKPSSLSTTVRVKGGKPIITDGPFAETREQLGGYYLIEAGTMEQAVEWAAKCPGVKGGCIEVRGTAQGAPA